MTLDALTGAIYDHLATDATLAGLLATYGGQPAVFTVEPVPGDAALPYVVTTGQVSDAAFDTKTTLGRRLMRDVRCFAAADGSAVVVEAIAERVRELLHRVAMVIPGFVWIIGECSGPVVADEPDAYGRIVTVRLTMEEL